ERDPGTGNLQRDLSASYERVGNALVAGNHRDLSLEPYMMGLAITRQLVESDPGNNQWQDDFASSSERIGDVLVALGKYTDALAPYEQNLTIRRMLADGTPGSIEAQRVLSVAYNK